jgi:hypothetical protein
MRKIIKTIEQSTIALLMLSLGFLVVEPAVSSSASVVSQFTETLGVTSEIAFAQSGSNITMTPNLPGLTGGTANGATQVRVVTNNNTGYNMTIVASSSLGMIGNTYGGTIPAYASAVNGVPDFTFTTPANRARFGYTVEASTTADLTQMFKDNGSACNAGSADAANSCWIAATTTAVQIINRSSYTADNGATTTIKFRVVINSNPSPLIPEDTYVATTTLTATENP